MNVFEVFTTTNYTFLRLDSNVRGNYIAQEYEANGVVKLRDSMTQTDNMETFSSDSSVHIRPEESFISDVGANLVGHGLRLSQDGNGPADYRIIEQRHGTNFETGQLEFIRVTVKRESLVNG